MGQGVEITPTYIKNQSSAEKKRAEPDPRFPPDPFLTVLRGIHEELSPQILKSMAKSGKPLINQVRLLGISFSLDDYHPNLLFMVKLPLTYEETVALCRKHPGTDYLEIKGGNLLAIPTDRDSLELKKVLSSLGWVAAGKASIIRCVEFLDTTKE